MSLKNQICLAGLIAGFAGTADAQVPGVPALQNAFINPGLAIAANYGTGSGLGFFGLAAGFGVGGRFQVSGAAGAQRGHDATRGAYGGRIAANVWNSSGGSLGAGAFAGVGGAPRTRAGNTVTNAAILNIPAGISFGYRRPWGDSRGVSVYASPIYRWTRTDDGSVRTGGTVRFAAGVDLALSQALGVTVGGEFGQNKAQGGGSAIALAATFAFGRR